MRKILLEKALKNYVPNGFILLTFMEEIKHLREDEGVTW